MLALLVGQTQVMAKVRLLMVCSRTFTIFFREGLSEYTLQYWDGSAWQSVPGGHPTANNKVWTRISFAAITTSKIKVVTNDAVDHGYSRVTEVEAWGSSTPPSAVNVALSTNGATASASSILSSSFPASGANNGDRKGTGWGSGGGWADSTSNSFPDWLQIDFSGTKTINEIDVFTLQDSYASPAEPTETMTFSTYGLSSYDVQYWDGSAWVTVTGGGITSNNKVWKKISFTALSTTKIRVWTHGSVDSGYSRITEVEAWSNTEASGTTSASINWLVTDQLGTPRMIFDKTGSLANARRHDYLPFGEELYAGQGGRAATQGYSGSDGVRQKFTQKERDIETGLDYFEARYYGSTQGRFTGVDPYNIVREVQITAQHDPNKAGAQLARYLSAPQQWNRYAYVANNPLKYVDPTGEKLVLTGADKAAADAALKRLQIMLGEEASGHLHVVVAQDRKTRDFLYIVTADVKDLGAVGGGKLGTFMSQIMDPNTKTVEFRIADSFTTKKGTFQTGGGHCGGACTVGSEESTNGHTQIFVNANASAISEEIFNRMDVSARFSPFGVHVWSEEDVVDAHEYGHAYANAIEGKPLYGSEESYPRAREFENLQRDTYPGKSKVRRVIE
jgi:RHS repeat-associated protein